jgi:hypothetical protein
MHQQEHVLEHKVLTGTDAEAGDPYGISRIGEACEKLAKGIVSRFSAMDQRIAQLEQGRGESEGRAS